MHMPDRCCTGVGSVIGDWGRGEPVLTWGGGPSVVGAESQCQGFCMVAARRGPGNKTMFSSMFCLSQLPPYPIAGHLEGSDSRSWARRQGFLEKKENRFQGAGEKTPRQEQRRAHPVALPCQGDTFASLCYQ